jgi:hypothetical protein
LPPCRNSFGGYVASTPTTILPAEAIFGGSLDFRSGWAEADDVGLLGGALDEPLSDSEFDPHPAAARSRAPDSAIVVRRNIIEPP